MLIHIYESTSTCLRTDYFARVDQSTARIDAVHYVRRTLIVTGAIYTLVFDCNGEKRNCEVTGIWTEERAKTEVLLKPNTKMSFIAFKSWRYSHRQ